MIFSIEQVWHHLGFFGERAFLHFWLNQMLKQMVPTEKNLEKNNYMIFVGFFYFSKIEKQI